MKIHVLKTWPVYFDAVQKGEKTFEIRKDDRNFEVGDTIHLKEYRDYGYPMVATVGYSGREMKRVITYIMRGGQFGLEEGYVILGIKKL